MRVRPVALIVAVFAGAAAVSAYVVAQLPREGQVSLLPAYAEPPTLPGTTPALDAASVPRDGAGVELRVTAGGEPVGDADVRVYLALAGAPDAGVEWRRAGTARTDAAGVARVAAPAGAYLAVVRAPGLAPARLAVARTSREEVARADVALEPPAALQGTVRDLEGAPIAGARVAILPAPTDGLRGAPPEETPAVTTGEDGGFQVGGLAPGLHAVRVEAPGRHPVLRAQVGVPHAGPLAVALEPLAAVSGVAVLEDGRPAAGASVVAASRDHAAAATADAEGRFTLALPTGSYRVVARAGDSAGSVGPLAVAPGEGAPALRLAVGPGASLEGSVADAPGGSPVAGARVAVALHDTAEVIARATTDARGAFRVAGLAPGAYDVRAVASDRGPARALAVTLAAGARFPLRLALEPTATVRGRVAGAGGAGMAGVRVRVVTPGDRLTGPVAAETRTDFEGRFELTGLEAGRAEVTARQDGALAGIARSVELRAGGAAEANLVLPEPGLLVGRVGRADAARARAPAGLAGFAVVAVPARSAAAGLQAARALADGNGNFQLAVPAGEYRVYAASTDEAGGDARVTPAFARVEPGRTTRLELAPAPSGTEGLSISVVEPGGTPSPGAEVTLGRPGEGTVALATAAGDDGRVVLAEDMGLGGRDALVRARNGGRIGTWTGRLPARGTVAVKLSAAGGIEGVVRARGAPVAGFTLEVASRPAAGAWRTVEVSRFAGDRFVLGDLPPEAVRVAVRADDGRRGEVEVTLASGETRAVEVPVR